MTIIPHLKPTQQARLSYHNPSGDQRWQQKQPLMMRVLASGIPDYLKVEAKVSGRWSGAFDPTELTFGPVLHHLNTLIIGPTHRHMPRKKLMRTLRLE